MERKGTYKLIDKLLPGGSSDSKLTPQELREKLMLSQKRHLTLYIASYLNTLKDDPNLTDLRSFVLRNCNTGRDLQKLTQVHEDYIPTKLVKECFSELMDTEFTVYQVGRAKQVERIDKADFILSHKGVTELPRIYCVLPADLPKA